MGSVVTGLGMVSSVGHTVEATAGAVRAGVVRPHPLPDFVTPDDDVVSGYPVRGFTEGFREFGLWVRLGAGCLDDLLRFEQAVPDRDWGRIGLITVTPLMQPDRFLHPAEGVRELIAQRYVDALIAVTGVGIPRNHRMVLETGHTGAAEGVLLARRWLETGRFDGVLVVSADSYLDPEGLEYLGARGALKTPAQPQGAMPGEAGACIMVEPEEGARRGGHAASVSLLAEHWIEGPELPPPDPDDPEASAPDPAEVGQRWAATIASALQVKGGAAFSGDVWIDLNGEVWRSVAWGHAMTRLHRVVDFSRCRAHYVAASLGEVGAAAGVSAVCLAARAYARGYATSNETLICSLGDRGRVSAMLLGAPA